MKKLFLTLSILICGLCFTFCQNKQNKTPTGFIQPEVNPSLYQNKNEEKVDLQDTAIIKKFMHSIVILKTK